jgi:hypothetical protein
MSREKQIEEMARDICRVKQSCNDVCHPINSCRALKYAERFYNAGYRKQSEGEWLTDKYGMDRSVCSLCHANYEGDGGKFCSNCGASMKGGAE